jgi:hypothetical protein
MESLLPVPSLQKRKHPNDFNKTPRPSMNKQKWYSTIYNALLMNEVDIKRIEPLDCDFSLEVRELVKSCFSCAPAVGVEPVRRQLLNVLSLELIRIQHSWFRVEIEELAVGCRKSILRPRAPLESLRLVACASTWSMPLQALQFGMV